MTLVIGAIILAAGAGKRMGGRSKALLELDGVSFLERVVGTLRQAECEKVWAVGRPGVPEFEALAEKLDVPVVLNPDPERGMFSSVLLGLQSALEIDPDLESLLIAPVDHPRVKRETVVRILEALSERKPPSRGRRHLGTWVQPLFARRGGHPIAVDATGARSLIEADPSWTLRQALDRAGLRRLSVVVEDRHIIENLNVPEDLP